MEPFGAGAFRRCERPRSACAISSANAQGPGIEKAPRDQGWERVLHAKGVYPIVCGFAAT